MDEDIDERAEDIAESISTQVGMCRACGAGLSSTLLSIVFWVELFGLLFRLKCSFMRYVFSSVRCAGLASLATWVACWGTACSLVCILPPSRSVVSAAPAALLASARLVEMVALTIAMLICRFRWRALGCWRYWEP